MNWYRVLITVHKGHEETTQQVSVKLMAASKSRAREAVRSVLSRDYRRGLAYFTGEVIRIR